MTMLWIGSVLIYGGLDGPAREVTVEPVEVPATEPKEVPDTPPQPVEPVKEPVPA